MADAPTPPARADFRLNAAILVTIVIEAIAGLLWIGAAAQRLDSLEARIEQSSPVSERLARLETELIALRTTMARIETRLDEREDRQ